MSAPFHFPTEYGKLGNWPGSLGPNQAQALLMEALTHKRGAAFVELGFDGGRTTVVLNWAAREIGDVRIVSTPVLNDETGLWYRRAQALFGMNRERVTGVEAIEPFAADMIVLNPGVSLLLPLVTDWIRLAPSGASIVRIGAAEELPGLQEIAKAPGIAIWHKVQEPQRAIDRAIESVAGTFIKDRTVSLDSNQRAKIHSLRRDKKRNGDGNSADSEVHEPVVANAGAELLPS